MQSRKFVKVHPDTSGGFLLRQQYYYIVEGKYVAYNYIVNNMDYVIVHY